MNTKSSNVVWYHATVTRKRRESLNGHDSAMLWFTGLSGAGKSTLAHAVEEHLHQMVAVLLLLMATMYGMGCVQTSAFQARIASKISAEWVKWASFSWKRA